MARGHVKCSECGQVLGKAGVTSHIRSRHPEIFEEFNKDKAAYYKANACEADGTSAQNAGGSTLSAPEQTSPENDTPIPPTSPEPAQDGEPAPAKETFPEPKPKPKTQNWRGGIIGLASD